ncbi:GOLPH3/VPS74 family protein [Streptomyces sp. cg35]|uniref:GOLPH3/VPS74 family protein n=1 Tax=Streptomyces sp. cg35 TaxID=3421650 RepID=UPI003D1677AB
MTMNITLGEQVLLLCLDDSGTVRQQPTAEYMIAAGALLELAMADRVHLDGARLVTTDTTAVGSASLDPVLARLAEPAKKTGDAQEWIFALHKEAFAAARQDLLGKGLVREERGRTLGIIKTTRYPETDGRARAEVRHALDETVVQGAEPDERTAALITLIHHGDLHGIAFPDADSAAVKRRCAEVAEAHWARPALRALVDAVAASVAYFMSLVAVNAAVNS